MPFSCKLYHVVYISYKLFNLNHSNHLMLRVTKFYSCFFALHQFILETKLVKSICEPLARSLKLDTLDGFDVNVIIHVRVGKHDLKGDL